jgi:hypothetical protein
MEGYIWKGLEGAFCPTTPTVITLPTRMHILDKTTNYAYRPIVVDS